MPFGEGKCKKCGAPILWVQMVRDGKPGKFNPLDVVPVQGGNIERKNGTTSGKYYGLVVPECERTKPLYVSHYATCPAASYFRGGGR